MKVGILGGGQLAWMLSLAAKTLNVSTCCLEPNSDTTASHVSEVIHAELNDLDAIEQFCQDLDVVTWETENIPLSCAKKVATLCPLYPSLAALEKSQERYLEKSFFQSIDIATAKFYPIDAHSDLQAALQTVGLPAILKTRRFGYDGKGQYLIKTTQDLEAAWQDLSNQALILEQFIPFSTEVSMIATRAIDGQCAFYPLVENLHQAGILRISKAPYNNAPLFTQAKQIMQKTLDALDYIGTLTIEFFVHDNKLIVNEMAPRVHNSGHWTIEGAQTSQFENHIRAICGLPLGDASPKGVSAMFNCIGAEPDLQAINAIADTHWYSYQKQARAKRKLGHLTINCDNEQTLQQRVDELTPLLGEGSEQ